jgi:hypothetical protein
LVANEHLGGRRRQAGAHLEHAHQRLATIESGVDRRQIRDEQRDDAEPEAGLDEGQDVLRQTVWEREPEREHRRPDRTKASRHESTPLA